MIFNSIVVSCGVLIFYIFSPELNISTIIAICLALSFFISTRDLLQMKRVTIDKENLTVQKIIGGQITNINFKEIVRLDELNIPLSGGITNITVTTGNQKVRIFDNAIHNYSNLKDELVKRTSLKIN